jgi:hypothetical protein
VIVVDDQIMWRRLCERTGSAKSGAQPRHRASSIARRQTGSIHKDSSLPQDDKPNLTLITTPQSRTPMRISDVNA